MATLNTQVRSGFTTHEVAYLEKRFLTRLEKETQFQKWGLKRMIPMHTGTTMRWHRFANLNANITPLTESITPDGLILSTATVEATIAGYGQYVVVSDFLEMVAINSTMRDAVDLLAYAAALSIDTLQRNELESVTGSSILFAGGAANAAAVQTGLFTLTSTELRKVAKGLAGSDVKKINGDYVGVIHPFSEFDLLSESTANSFVQLSANTTRDMVEDGHIGRAYGINLNRSTNIRTGVSVGVDDFVYRNIFFGDEAYGNVDLAGAQTKIITKEKGSSGVEDALDQRASVGYKFYYATKKLDNARIRLVHSYSA